MFRSVVLLGLILGIVPAELPAGESGLEGGYVLVAPLGSETVHLIDADKNIVHTWKCGEGPGNATYLEKDGSLLRTAKVESRLFPSRGGGGGRVRRFSWEGELLWDHVISDDSLHHHHDVEPMPNGNVLVIAWERHTRAEAIDAGRDPRTIAGDAVWTETILELKPSGRTDAEIVWKWRLWDHLIQDHDETKANHGPVADHPELVDLNFGTRRGGADWIHMNSIDFNPKLDQIVLSARWFNEAWIIDHATTTKEAAGHSGGRRGKGGDLLYRWGNPAAYRRRAERQLFAQHDLRWIEDGCPGAGHLMLFNNGDPTSSRDHSSVDEFETPVDEDGNYPSPESAPFGPRNFAWSYSDPESFASQRISGAQRLPNGNTFVCSGQQGWLFEVTPDGKRVWELKIVDLVGGRRGAAFRAPWYPVSYSPAFEKLERRSVRPGE